MLNTEIIWQNFSQNLQSLLALLNQNIILESFDIVRGFSLRIPTRSTDVDSLLLLFFVFFVFFVFDEEVLIGFYSRDEAGPEFHA